MASVVYNYTAIDPTTGEKVGTKLDIVVNVRDIICLTILR